MKGIIITLIVLISLSSASMGSALPAKIDLNPLLMEIPIGSTGTYNLTLNTTEEGNLSWDTGDINLSARIDSEAFSQSGHISGLNGTTVHTLEVKPLSGITVGKVYDIALWHTQGGGIVVKASATAGVVPIPEISTVFLTSAGIIGLLGISRMNRK